MITNAQKTAAVRSPFKSLCSCNRDGCIMCKRIIGRRATTALRRSEK